MSPNKRSIRAKWLSIADAVFKNQLMIIVILLQREFYHLHRDIDPLPAQTGPTSPTHIVKINQNMSIKIGILFTGFMLMN